ncbi:MAG: hypothetical protein ACJ74W_24570 [Pyrinomonadaceae bacterium]
MTKETQTLAKFSPAQLERFLVELANLQNEPEAIERFQRRFAALIPTAHRAEWLSRAGEARPKPSETYLRVMWILLLRKLLRGVLLEQDLRRKEWRVFEIRGWFYSLEREAFWDEIASAIMEDRNLPDVPPPMPFEQALLYGIKSADRLRYCANPECPAPYFFVKRKNQRYCSEICAGPAQRELKRQWWAEHGEEWRMARQGKKPSKKGTGKSSKTPKQTAKKGRREGK